MWCSHGGLLVSFSNEFVLPVQIVGNLHWWVVFEWPTFQWPSAHFGTVPNRWKGAQGGVHMGNFRKTFWTIFDSKRSLESHKNKCLHGPLNTNFWLDLWTPFVGTNRWKVALVSVQMGNFWRGVWTLSVDTIRIEWCLVDTEQTYWQTDSTHNNNAGMLLPCEKHKVARLFSIDLPSLRPVG